ncbi:MAG TPA: hypothetical protein VF593_03805 [Chthoniobacteraceae bacterium]|jgi:hypothetical protein
MRSSETHLTISPLTAEAIAEIFNGWAERADKNYLCIDPENIDEVSIQKLAALTAALLEPVRAEFGNN